MVQTLTKEDSGFVARHSMEGPPVLAFETDWLSLSGDPAAAAELQRRMDVNDPRLDASIQLFPDGAALRRVPLATQVMLRLPSSFEQVEPPDNPASLTRAKHVYWSIRHRQATSEFQDRKKELLAEHDGRELTADNLAELKAISGIVAVVRIRLRTAEQAVANLPEEIHWREQREARQRMLDAADRAEAARQTRNAAVRRELESVTIDEPTTPTRERMPCHS